MNIKFRQPLKWLILLIIAALSAAVMVSMAAYLYLAPLLPSAETYKTVQLETPLRIYTADNRLIDEIGNRRNPVSFNQIPQVMKDAVIASEDPRFYSHPGVDLLGLIRGFWGFVRGINLGGGSTITMQLANNISFENDNVYLRKFKEIPFALRIQQELTKEEILTLYLNLVYFGAGAEGIDAASFVYYGKSASELTLAEAAMLTSVLPCPSPCNPLTNPDRAVQRRNIVLQKMYDEGMIDRNELNEAIQAPVTASRHARNIEVPAPYVAEMVRQHLYDQYGEETYSRGFDVITTIDGDRQIAANAALVDGLETYYDKRHGYRGPAAKWPADTADPEAYWLELLQAESDYGNQQPAIVTSISSLSFQALLRNGEQITVPWEGISWAHAFRSRNEAWPPPQQASDVVAIGDLIRIKQNKGNWELGQIPDIQGALISLSPSNGEIIALVGGYDFRHSQVNRVLAARPPGSNFKPFVYGAALEDGYTAATSINDAPFTRGEYRPSNYENNFIGPITLRHALQESRNVPTVRLYDQLGSGKVLAFAAKLGINTSNFPRNDLTVALGSQDVAPMEMVNAYATIANGGYKVEPWFIKQISSVGEGIIFKENPLVACDNCAPTEDETADPVLLAPQVVDSEVAFILNTMLRSVIEEGSGNRVQRDLKRGDLMGKTGTTNGPQELWFSGYNRDIATTVFVGFDQPEPLGEREQGATIAVPIWIDYMRSALANSPENTMRRPDGIVNRLINKRTGALATPGDANTIFEYFRSERAPEVPNAQLPAVELNVEESEVLSTETIF